MITIKLPGRGELHVRSLDSSLKTVVANCSEALHDKKISPQNFGGPKHFYFKANGKALIEDEGFFLENYTLREMRMKDGAVLEFCYALEATKA